MIVAIGIAGVAAVGAAAVAYKVRHRLCRSRRAATSTGVGAHVPVRVADWREMDFVLAAQRCPRCACGLDNVGETTRYYQKRELRVARLQCPTCPWEQRVHVHVTGGDLSEPVYAEVVEPAPRWS